MCVLSMFWVSSVVDLMDAEAHVHGKFVVKLVPVILLSTLLVNSDKYEWFKISQLVIPVTNDLFGFEKKWYKISQACFLFWENVTMMKLEQLLRMPIWRKGSSVERLLFTLMSTNSVLLCNSGWMLDSSLYEKSFCQTWPACLLISLYRLLKSRGILSGWSQATIQ